MKKIYSFLILLLMNTVLFSQITNNDFNNGAADGGLWTSPTNWSQPNVPGPTNTVRTLNSATSFVNADFTIFKIQNSAGTGGDRFVNSSSGGVLTINTGANDLPAISSLSNSGVKLGFRGRVTIDNGIDGGFSNITLANNASNSVEFESTSVLTLISGLKVVQGTGSGDNFLFNGKLAGAGNLILAINTSVTFGNSTSNTGYTGELVLNTNSSLIVNTLDNVIFYDGLKIQVNGTDASTTLNGENVFQSGITVGSSHTFTFNVNKNQNSMTKINLPATGVLNMVIDNAVTNVTFEDNSGSNWSSGTINITGFKNKTIRFGTDANGLTDQQLSQITGNGNGGLDLDAFGYLFDPTTLSNEDYNALTFSMYPNPAYNVINIKSPSSTISKVAIYDITGKQVLLSNKIVDDKIDVSNLNTGIYVLRLEDTSNSVSTKKLVITR